MVSTQDVGFGTLWAKLVGPSARWEPGDDEVPALHVEPGDPPLVGMGLVSVWVVGDGPVLVCNPSKGLKAIKDLRAPISPDELRNVLRAAGAVLHEGAARRDSVA